MATQVSRDPFARASLMRRHAEPGQECAWCGQPARWAYARERDDRPLWPRDWPQRVFCSVGCCRANHARVVGRRHYKCGRRHAGKGDRHGTAVANHTEARDRYRQGEAIMSKRQVLASTVMNDRHQVRAYVRASLRVYFRERAIPAAEAARFDVSELAGRIIFAAAVCGLRWGDDWAAVLPKPHLSPAWHG